MDRIVILDPAKTKSYVFKHYYKYNGYFTYEETTPRSYPKTILLGVIPAMPLYSAQ